MWPADVAIASFFRVHSNSKSVSSFERSGSFRIAFANWSKSWKGLDDFGGDTLADVATEDVLDVGFADVEHHWDHRAFGQWPSWRQQARNHPCHLVCLQDGGRMGAPAARGRNRLHIFAKGNAI